MTITTDNVRLGAVDGMGNGPGSASIPTSILNLVGDPSAVVTVQNGSDVAYDSANGEFYMGKGAGTTTWVRLGSLT